MSETGKRDGDPERRCIATGRRRPRGEMIRFVLDPDGRVVPDLDGRLPGRGFWLSADRDVLNTACAKRLFSKAARRPVVVPDGFVADVERLLVRRCLDRIGLARRAGQAVAGFEKVRERLRSARDAVAGGVLLTACDGSEDGRGKIGRLATGLRVIDLFSAAELGAATGRERAVHVLLSPGGLANALVRDAERLAGFRRGHGDDG